MSLPVLQDSADRLTDAIYFGSRQGAASPVPSNRTITAGFGLTGGGDLSSNRSFRVNDLPAGYNVLNHGVVADGVTDNTAAYASAFAAMGATGGTLVFPPGVYAGSILIPSTPDNRRANYNVIGSGIGVTWLIPHTSNTKLLSKLDRGGVLEGAYVGGFSIRAHASGSTGEAIDMAGFRFSRLFDVGYASNAGGDYASLIHLSAKQMRTYANVISHIVIDGGTVQNTGPATIVLFDNKDDAGTPSDLTLNSNNNVIEDFDVYSNVGITVGIDALRGANNTIRNNFFESNAGCTYFIPGEATLAYGNNCESGVTTNPVLFTSVANQGSGGESIFLKNFFSDMTALDCPVDGVRWQDNTVYTLGGYTINDTGQRNIFEEAANVLAGTLVTKKLGSSGAAPTVVSTNLGVGGAVVVLTGSNDTDGIIELDFGTSVPDSKGVITLTFAEPYNANPCVMVCPASGSGDMTLWAAPVSGTPAIQVRAVSPSHVTIQWATSAAPGDNTNVRINYHVKGLPN